jgi:hypothetical protein
VRYGTSPDDIGLLLSTIGSTAVGMLTLKPKPSAADFELALTSLFSGILGVADKANVICQENQIKIEINNPHIEDKATWCHECLGGPLASIAASIAAETWDRPVRIRQEEMGKEKLLLELEVLE